MDNKWIDMVLSYELWLVEMDPWRSSINPADQMAGSVFCRPGESRDGFVTVVDSKVRVGPSDYASK